MTMQSRRAVPIVFGSVPKDRHPVCESGNAHSSWISAPGSPLDLRGPVDRPFDRMGPEFAGVAALEHLTAVARKFPDKIAISDGACEFSYAALLSKVLGLAHIIATAVPDGQAVGLLLGNSVWHPIATLACMAAGRPSVPLNPRDPAQRHVEIVTSARIPVLIGQGAGDFIRMVRATGRPVDRHRPHRRIVRPGVVSRPGLRGCAGHGALHLGQYRTAQGRRQQSAQPACARAATGGCLPYRSRRYFPAPQRSDDHCRLQRDAVRAVVRRNPVHRRCRGHRSSRHIAADAVAANNHHLLRSGPSASVDRRG